MSKIEGNRKQRYITRKRKLIWKIFQIDIVFNKKLVKI